MRRTLDEKSATQKKCTTILSATQKVYNVKKVQQEKSVTRKMCSMKREKTHKKVQHEKSTG